MTEDNMKLWDSMSQVDPGFTKKITGKPYSGNSPNPTWVIRTLTEQLGPIGIAWGVRVVKETIHEGVPHQVLVERTKGADGAMSERYDIIREQYHQVLVEFWRDCEGEQRTFSAYGGTQLFYKTKAGKWVHDEDAAKKSLTDAMTKGASWLGVAADLFLGLYDDRYAGATERDVEPGTRSSSDPWA